MVPSRGFVKADDGAQKHGLAGARAADDAQHFAAINVEIEMVVDDLGTEAGDQAADADDHFFLVRRSFCVVRHHTPRTENMTEKAASSTITRKTDSTTARVVSRPTLAALRSTWKPS